MVSSLSTGAPQVPVPSNGTVTQQADVFHSSTIPSVPPHQTRTRPGAGPTHGGQPPDTGQVGGGTVHINSA